MTNHSHPLKKLFLLPYCGVVAFAIVVSAQDKTGEPVQAKPDTAVPAARVFYELADKALLAMKQRAEELKIKGVAVVAYIPGEKATSWCSKMLVVGHLTSGSSTNDPGSNLLAIAYSKASEMADTLKRSGSGVRPPMKGEFGWQGGWIEQCKTGYIIAAFSGGRSEDDVQVSKTGVAVFGAAL
jgi:hypothetical protein